MYLLVKCLDRVIAGYLVGEFAYYIIKDNTLIGGVNLKSNQMYWFPNGNDISENKMCELMELKGFDKDQYQSAADSRKTNVGFSGGVEFLYNMLIEKYPEVGY